MVAGEVRRLAENSAQATERISRLVAQIQSDTSAARTSIDFATQGVVEGTRAADATERVLNEIETESERISDLIQSMAAGLQGQSKSIAEISAQMTFMRDVTKNNAQNARHTAQSIANLAALR